MIFLRKLFILISKLSGNKRGFDMYLKDFEKYAQSYDDAVTRQLLGKFTEESIKNLNLKPGMCCIDLGCGTGHAMELMHLYIKPGGVIIGCDISKSMLEIARKKLRSVIAAEFVEQDMIRFLKARKDNSADIITVFWALGYSSPSKVIKQIGRVLAKDGCCAMLVNTQASLFELQKITLKIIMKNPLILKCVPQINFPSGVEEFKRMLKNSGIKTDILSQDSCVQSFDCGESLVSWIKTSGPCAGFRESIKEKYRDYVFDKIRESVDKKGSINLTFNFIRFMGTKQ